MFFDFLKKNDSIWKHYTKQEEYHPQQLDQHGRCLREFNREFDIEQPTVSEFLVKNNFLDVEYPEQKKFALCLTHDIDALVFPIRKYLSYSYRSMTTKNLRKLMIINRNFLMRKSSFLNFRRIINIEQKYNAVSSFYFLATNRDFNSPGYFIEHYEESINQILDFDCEIGLHIGYYSYDQFQKIIEEKKKLEKIIGRQILGCRNHFLRFRIPDTWHLLSKAGFRYDTTFAYADAVGFRNGMCHPFIPFDLKESKSLNIIEIPLIVMDTSLISYLGLTPKDSWELIRKLMDSVERNNGVFTLLWHNITFAHPIFQEWENLYIKILKYANNRNAWLTNGENIWRLYQNYFNENIGH